MIKPTKIIGTMVIDAAALLLPQSTDIAPTNLAIPTGRVYESIDVSCKENKSSFHEYCIERIIAEAIAGSNNGKIIFQNVCILRAPSIAADSINSFGMALAKLSISHITNGRLTEECASIGPRYVPPTLKMLRII
jgi:hypothetical protein